MQIMATIYLPLKVCTIIIKIKGDTVRTHGLYIPTGKPHSPMRLRWTISQRGTTF